MLALGPGPWRPGRPGGQRAGDADGADELPADDYRQAALKGSDVYGEEAQTGAAGGDGVVERLARALDVNEVWASPSEAPMEASRGLLESCEHHQIAAAVEDGDRDLPGILGGFELSPPPSRIASSSVMGLAGGIAWSAAPRPGANAQTVTARKSQRRAGEREHPRHRDYLPCRPVERRAARTTAAKAVVEMLPRLGKW